MWRASGEWENLVADADTSSRCRNKERCNTEILNVVDISAMPLSLNLIVISAVDLTDYSLSKLRINLVFSYL